MASYAVCSLGEEGMDRVVESIAGLFEGEGDDAGAAVGGGDGDDGGCGGGDGGGGGGGGGGDDGNDSGAPAPPTGTAEAVQLWLLAQATVQTIERYYLAIALLLRAGSGELAQDGLEKRCTAMAQRMAMPYGLNAPEFFDRTMFRAFIGLLRQRQVIQLGLDGRLAYGEALRAVADDARIVLSEQIRNSILQVTHS